MASQWHKTGDKAAPTVGWIGRSTKRVCIRSTNFASVAAIRLSNPPTFRKSGDPLLDPHPKVKE
jgi:hypothetical protein